MTTQLPGQRGFWPVGETGYAFLLNRVLGGVGPLTERPAAGPETLGMEWNVGDGSWFICVENGGVYSWLALRGLPAQRKLSFTTPGSRTLVNLGDYGGSRVILIRAWGPGGGGGGASSGTDGGGGGGGSYAERLFALPASAPDVTLDVWVGAGGSGGVYNGANDSIGGVGTATLVRVGSYIILNMARGTPGKRGAAGVGTGGQFGNIAGSAYRRTSMTSPHGVFTGGAGFYGDNRTSGGDGYGIAYANLLDLARAGRTIQYVSNGGGDSIHGGGGGGSGGSSHHTRAGNGIHPGIGLSGGGNGGNGGDSNLSQSASGYSGQDGGAKGGGGGGAARGNRNAVGGTGGRGEVEILILGANA